MKKIEVGDTVKLKSGGPSMTVKGEGNYGISGTGILCVWFDGTKLKDGVFVEATLTHVEAK